MDTGIPIWQAFRQSLLKQTLFYFFPEMMEKPMALSMDIMSAVVAQISSPVLTPNMNHDLSRPKENRLVNVVRWDSYQKDFPLLLKAGVEFSASPPRMVV